MENLLTDCDIFLLIDKEASQTSLQPAVDVSHPAHELKASSEEFHLSLPQYETPEQELHKKAVPGSSSSLDELCGRTKIKADKEERFSKISKKLFGKKEKETSKQDDQVSKSAENVPNGKKDLVEETDVDIEICPIDHIPDTEEQDIDIYPLDDNDGKPDTVSGTDNHLVNGLSDQHASTDLEFQSDVDRKKIVNAAATQRIVNDVDAEVEKSAEKLLFLDNVYHQVLSGNMSVTVPNSAKIVRIFTSSTFTDARVEQNALMSRVYPKLRDFCHEKGYEFQVVDMRWGIHDPCTDDHMFSEVSLEELSLCQELSTGPNFVTFLSHKYGYRPFPRTILASEFDSLFAAVEDEDEKQLLQVWFKRDDNAIPPEYILQPISSQFTDFFDPPSVEARQQALKEWWEVFLNLQNALRKAATKTLPENAVHKYLHSDSEEEIKKGILERNSSSSQAFWFRRNITGIEGNLNNPRAAKYVDVEELPLKVRGKGAAKGLDKSAKANLKSLKENQIPKELADSNIASYNINWGEKGVDTHSNKEHAQYIENLCQYYNEKMKKNIEEAVKEKRNTKWDNEVFEEAAQHVINCKNLSSSSTCIPSKALDAIKDYITGQSNSPLVIHGKQGCGKTSLIAMAANSCQTWYGGEVATVVRFLGTTHHSSKVHSLLRSICRQLCLVYKADSKKVPQDYQNLEKEFHVLLRRASPSQPLVVLLDSLDQLWSYNIKRELSWLPNKLPPHVKIVLTCLTGDQAFSCLKGNVADESHFVEIQELTDIETVNIMKLCLQNSNRKLTEPQESLLLKQVSNCRSQLYLKLALEQALTWKSYTALEEASLGASVREMIISLFEHLEVKHGKEVFQHSLAYITASRRGISEADLEDVLSCDEVVLDKLFSSWAPPIRRLPLSLWLLIKADVGCFLAAHVENGVRLITWAHQEFHDIAMEKFLFSDDKDLQRFHSELADYFIGRWTQGAKKGDGKGNVKERHLPRQPLQFADNVFNYRKMKELPFHLLKSDDFERLKQSALCNFEFLSVKLKATSVHDVIDDFIEALAVRPDDPDLKLVFETLQLSMEALNVSTDQLSSQLIGRLSSSRSPSPFISRLLRQAHHPSNPALIPNVRCLARPGGRLVHSLPSLHGSLVLSQNGDKAMNGSDDQLITLWNVKSGEVEKTLDTSRPIRYLEFCLDEQFVIASCQGSLQFWNLDKAQMVWEIPSTETPAPIAVAGIRDTLVAILDKVIKFVNLTDGTLTRDFVDKKFLHDRIAGLGNSVAFASSTAAYVRVYDLNTKDIRLSIKVSGEDSVDVVKKLILTPFHGGQLIVSLEKSSSVRVFELNTGKCLHILGPDILYPAVTKNGRHMLCTNNFNDIAIWNLETAIKEKQVLKHPPTTAIVRVSCVDLKTVVTVSDDLMARVWDLETQEGSEVCFEDNKETNSIQQLIPIKSSVQKQVITKSKTPGPICVWNLSSCQIIRTLNNTNADEILVVDDTRAVIRCGTKLAIIDLQEGKLIKHMRSDFPPKTDKVHRHASSLYKRRDLALRLAESPRVPALSTTLKFSDCALVGTTHVLILSKDRLYLKLASIDTGELVAKLKSGLNAIIETVMVSGNGLVAVCSCENAPLIVWDLRDKAKRYTLQISGHYPGLTTADISYNGHYLVDVTRLEKTRKSVVTWDLETGKVKHIIGHGMNVWNVVVSSLSMRMVVAGRLGANETLRVYDLVTGEFYHQLNGHIEPVKGVCLSRDGKRALTYVPLGVRDRTVRIWNLMSGTLLACFTPDLPVSSCILTDDGDQVAMVINKSRPIVSLALSHEVGSRELSVDVSNPYFSHPTLHGAVFDMNEELKWDNDDDDNSDNETEVDV
ncbi:NACHT and WD repeat domain-containing protein 2-like isoform X2 [Stylophora pistillata]|uniref:NACHT and WD repeat domain-containing protein 2-like isoform X2 n=1 Tax=Stylophora pistillata TaxID=50429 RepID=UPI000C042505|nr:NACHT and WD repeat domain-containing protein 2-like isoform X2 [Stylophora pistillata]